MSQIFFNHAKKISPAALTQAKGKEDYFEKLISLANREEEEGCFDKEESLIKSKTFQEVRKMKLQDINLLIDYIYSHYDVAPRLRYDSLTLQRDFIADRGYPKIIKNFYAMNKKVRQLHRIRKYTIYDLKNVLRTRGRRGSEKLIIALLLTLKTECPPSSKQEADNLIKELCSRYTISQGPRVQISDRIISAYYMPETKTILLPKNYIASDIIHEFGHFMFHERTPSQEFLDKLENLYDESKQRDNSGIPFWEAIDDSNYICGSIDGRGHPNDSVDEFFASTFFIFTAHKNEFIKNINKKGEKDLSAWAERLTVLFQEIGI